MVFIFSSCSGVCNDNREGAGITPFSADDVLAGFINSAQSGTCPNPGEVCCNIKHIPPPPPPAEPKCSDQNLVDEGYK